MKLPISHHSRLGMLSVFGTVWLMMLTASCFAEVAKSVASDLDQKIDHLIMIFRQQTKVPATSVLVTKGDKVIYEKYFGLANIEQDIKVTKDTEFPVGSITKQFTGLAIAQLVTEGKLSLDDNIHKFIPDYPDNAEKVTIRHLLNHTSGITNYTTKSELHENAWKKHSHEDMMAWFKDDPLVFETGTRWNYTNSGIYLLGMVIEKISGLSYGEYLQKNIFKPFGMTHSYLAGSKDIILKRASGYDLTEEGYKNARAYDVSVPFSAGGIISTTEDIKKYLHNVHQSDLVSDDVRRIIYTQEILPDGTKLFYTLGCLFSGEFEGHRVYSHAGEIYGFYADTAYYPDDDISIIIFTNRMGYLPSPPSLSRKIVREVLGIEQPKYDAEMISEADKINLSGTYHFTSETFFQNDKATISFAEGALILHLGPTEEKMFPLPFEYVGKGKFIMKISDEFILNTYRENEKQMVSLQQGHIIYTLQKELNKN